MENIKNEELYDLQFGLKQASRHGGKLGYAIAKNLRNVTAEVKALDAMLKHSDAWKQEHAEQTKICEKYCIRDNNGQVVPSKSGAYQYTPENKELHAAAIAKRREENIKVYEDREAQLEVYKQKLEEPIDFDLHMIHEKDLPIITEDNDDGTKGITAAEMAGIDDIIIWS